MSADVRTLNLSENDDGMVPLTTSFVEHNQPEKNVSQNKEMTMDSTPISDIMGQPEMPLEPPMMDSDPRVQHQPMVMQQPVMVSAPPQPQQQQQPQVVTQTKNPFNLTDEQMQILIVAICTAAAISKPVQEKLAIYVPQFLNEQGQRSMIGLASTGAVAAGVLYILKKYA